MCATSFMKNDHRSSPALQFLKEHLNYLKEQTSTWPGTLRNVYVSSYVSVAQEYLDATEGRRVCWYIACVNASIFLAWKSRRLLPFMQKAFTHDPLSGRAYTLLTSIFRWVSVKQCMISRRVNVECNSHKSFLHLIANNMALCSFGEYYACDALRSLTSPTNFRLGCHNMLLFPTAKQPRPTARSH